MATVMRKRWARPFAGVVALAIVALVTVAISGSASSDPGVPTTGLIGELELFANDSAGDGFQYIPAGSATATLTEAFTSNNQGRISESGDDLTELLAEGIGSGGQLYPALKAHRFGVKDQGEGSGTPASQINNSGPSAQALTIDLTPAPGDGAWYAEVALKFKFGATVLVEALDAAGGVVTSTTLDCGGGDCGPDSGEDRDVVTLGAGDVSTVFTAVRISIASPSDGAVSLIDDTGFETSFSLVATFDGDLDCDQSDSVESGGISGEFTRLNTALVEADCGTRKVYNLDIVGNEVRFEPEAGINAVYRADLRFPAGTPMNPLSDDLEYDQDGLGPADFVHMQWCNLMDATYPAGASGSALYFPELEGLGTGGVNAFPTLDGLPNDSNGLPPTSCIVAFSTVQGGDDYWVGYLEGDPFYL